ncbi:MAG: hypothetical protein Tsb0021_10460 [Chlamydiales bacterium]
MGKENNLLGFIDELISTIAREKKINIQFVSTAPNTLISGLDNDRYEAVVTQLTPSILNRQRFLFSDPLLRLGPVLVVHQESTIRSLSQLKEKIIGIQRGSASAFDTVRFPAVIITPYENLMLALDTLSRRRIDAVIMEAIPAYVYTQSFYRDDLKIATPPLTDFGLRLMTKTNQDNFMKLFDKGLEEIKEKGIYEDLIKKWGLFDPDKIQPISEETDSSAIPELRTEQF